MLSAEDKKYRLEAILRVVQNVDIEFMDNDSKYHLFEMIRELIFKTEME